MFGRSRSSTVVIPSSKASRNHATIHVQDNGEFWLIDLGSINGTFLNGSRVARPGRLANTAVEAPAAVGAAAPLRELASWRSSSAIVFL